MEIGKISANKASEVVTTGVASIVGSCRSLEVVKFLNPSNPCFTQRSLLLLCFSVFFLSFPGFLNKGFTQTGTRTFASNRTFTLPAGVTQYAVESTLAARARIGLSAAAVLLCVIYVTPSRQVIVGIVER